MNRSTVRGWSRGAALALTAGVLIVLAPATGSAAPTTTDQARQAVVDAGNKLRELDEQVHQATATAEEQQAAADAAGAAAAQAQVAVDALAPQLRAIALSGYTGSTRFRIAAFLTSDSAEDLVDTMSTLAQLANHADGVVAQVAVARDTAQQAQATAAAAQTAAEASVADLEAQQDALGEQLAGYEADLARLSAADQVTVQNVLSGPVLTTAKPAPAPTAAAGDAVQTALAQLGDAYVPGASGPDAFDCSGLTMYAYAAAGITLPHSSRAQSTMGTAVARADLQPGDLVFFYTPVSHVGLYIGNGQMVHASVPGRPVAVTSVDKAGYVGARRVTG
ncbi:Cell wall-associated hydrolase, NlpC family [Modestobacter sp. DSM 44400]|uniref:C40 family peptidase n=1 Tax=Modestobacter sp. DSM 44400 TaxID=1550230 RepID=UPI00089A7ED6|nr:C40 family peptidase [Modestobacter sp. DSM 44400]SDY32171.1 Cell wall-associated hydrolase, NlpC family [Modestobacter sp. DSM 44400]